MQSALRARSLIGLVGVSLFCSIVYGQEGDAVQPPLTIPAAVQTGAPPLALSARVGQQTGGYHDRASDDLAQSHAALGTELSKLEKFFGKRVADQQGWKQFLLWDDLQAALKAPQDADLSRLRATLAKFRSNENGLELKPFQRAAAALDRVVQALVAQRTKDAAVRFDRQVASLATGLATLEDPAVQDDPSSVHTAVNWLEARGQLPELVGEIRRAYSHSNLVLQVSSELVRAAGQRRIDDTAPVRDSILGTRITGTGRTVGKVDIRLLPDADEGMFAARLQAVNHSRTVGANGPARIFTRGLTQLSSEKVLSFDADGLRATPATAQANSQTKITGIGSTAGCVGDRLVKRIARRKIPKQKAQSERVASRHARKQLGQRFDDEFAPVLARVNRGYREKFRVPLIRRNAFPRELAVSTTASALEIRVLQDGFGKLAATTVAPALDGQPDLACRLHESWVNNLAASILSGRTLEQVQLEKLARETLGRLPESLADKDEQGPWSITFASLDPVTLRVHANEISLTFRARRYMTGERRYDGMDVTVRYQVAFSGGELRGVRQGEPEVLPPNYVAGEPVPLRLTSLRNLLKRRFGKLFPPEFAVSELRFPGELARLGGLEMNQFLANEGWLVACWQQPAGPSRLASW